MDVVKNSSLPSQIPPLFTLDERLQRDTIAVGSLALCDVLLMNDATYPWCILVPRRANISEIFQLQDSEQQQLWKETSFMAAQMKCMFHADKMNVAALGNVVAQLHMHVVARRQQDIAWPAPVWGRQPAVSYAAQPAQDMQQKIRKALNLAP